MSGYRFTTFDVYEREIVIGFYFGTQLGMRQAIAEIVIPKGPESHLSVRALTAPERAWKAGGPLPEGTQCAVSERWRYIRPL